jgi:hypothetical protein
VLRSQSRDVGSVQQCHPTDHARLAVVGACQTSEMRITDENHNPLTRVHLALTDAEAKELRDYLDALVKTREKGWHAHVMDERFWAADERERVECEVTIYRADDETASL